MAEQEIKDFKKQVVQMFRSERGHDFFKCFKDMSIKDASRICYIPVATFKRIRYDTKDPEWDFNKMKAGYKMNMWQEIKNFREQMMRDNDFKQFRDLLKHAARYGAAMQKVCVPKASEIEAMSLFEKGAREAAEFQRRAQCPPVSASAPIHVNPVYQHPNTRNWSVFSSLNQQELVHAWHLRQHRLAALTREAMHLVTSLPPPVVITSPAPLGFVPEPVMLPRRTVAEKPPAVDAESQACVNSALEAMQDKASWRDATPREINAGAPKPQPYYEGTATKELHLRSWMLVQSMVFDDSSRYIRSLELRWLANRHRSFTRTPEWAYDQEVRRFAFHSRENLQLDPELAALPDLEPYAGWGGLLTTGPAPPRAE